MGEAAAPSTPAVELPALDGANPLAVLAALGLVAIGDRMVGAGQWRLGWVRAAVATPKLFGPRGADQVVDVVAADLGRWRDVPVLDPSVDDVKFDEVRLRSFVEACAHADDGGRSAELCAALVAEGSGDNSGQSKPTDLHFTAGQQKFLAMARQLREGLEPADVAEALFDTWGYARALPSLKWDVTDDRVYALSASDPSREKKLTVPGAEWLALQGLTALPVFAAGRRTATTACGGQWKRGCLTWPLWSQPVGRRVSMTLLAHVGRGDSERCDGTYRDALDQWGVFRVLRCGIRRSEQGGYGSFSPPSVVWEGP